MTFSMSSGWEGGQRQRLYRSRGKSVQKPFLVLRKIFKNKSLILFKEDQQRQRLYSVSSRVNKTKSFAALRKMKISYVNNNIPIRARFVAVIVVAFYSLTVDIQTPIKTMNFERSFHSYYIWIFGTMHAFYPHLLVC